MKKFVPVAIAMFLGMGFAGVAMAADDAATAACKKEAADKKLEGDAAKKAVDECVAKAAKK